MKKLYILLFPTLIVLFAQAQIVEIPYLNPNQIIGVYNLRNDGAVLSFAETRTKDQKDIYLLSYLNEAQEKTTLAVDRGSRFVEMNARDGNNYIVFENSTTGIVDIFHFTTLSTLSQTTYPSPEGSTTYGGIDKVETNQAGNLFLFRYYAIHDQDDKGRDIITESGSEICAFNTSLSVLNKHKIAYSKNSHISGFTAIKEGFVLSVETKEDKERKYTSELHIYDNNLKKTGEHSLSVNGTYFPTELISHNNQIVIAGYNLAGSIFDSKTIEGLFIRTLNLDGTEKATNKFSWDKLKEKLKNSADGDFVFNGKISVLVEKIIPMTTGYRIICESYANNSGKTATEFMLGANDDNRVVSVYDFVVFDTDNLGALTAVQIFKKESMNIEIGEARMSKSTKIAFAYYMKKHNAFPFRYVSNNKITFVNYKNKTGYLAELDLTTGAITQGKPVVIEPTIEEEISHQEEEFIENNGMLNKLSNLDKKINTATDKLDEAALKLEYGIENIDYTFSPNQRQDFGYFTLSNGKTISYLFNIERHSIFFDYLN